MPRQQRNRRRFRSYIIPRLTHYRPGNTVYRQARDYIESLPGPLYRSSQRLRRNYRYRQIRRALSTARRRVPGFQRYVTERTPYLADRVLQILQNSEYAN